MVTTILNFFGEGGADFKREVRRLWILLRLKGGQDEDQQISLSHSRPSVVRMPFDPAPGVRS